MKIPLPAVVAVAVTILACGSGESATGPNTSIAGAYGLRTLNDSAPPYTLYNQGSSRLDLLADTFYLDRAGTFREITRYRQTLAGTTTMPIDSVTGTWGVQGTSTLVLKEAGTGTTLQGTIQGNSFAIMEQGVRAVYSK